MLTLATSSLFSTGHIALTAAISGVLAAAVALLWLRDQHRVLDALSANDWLAPTVTYVVLGVYGAVRAPTEPTRYQQARAAATAIALAVNVLTI